MVEFCHDEAVLEIEKNLSRNANTVNTTHVFSFFYVEVYHISEIYLFFFDDKPINRLISMITKERKGMLQQLIIFTNQKS